MFIKARNLDILFITETWLNVGDMDALGKLEREVDWFLFSRTLLHAPVSISNISYALNFKPLKCRCRALCSVLLFIGH